MQVKEKGPTRLGAGSGHGDPVDVETGFWRASRIPPQPPLLAFAWSCAHIQTGRQHARVGRIMFDFKL